MSTSDDDDSVYALTVVDGCCLVGCGRDSRLRVVLVMLRDTYETRGREIDGG